MKNLIWSFLCWFAEYLWDVFHSSVVSLVVHFTNHIKFCGFRVLYFSVRLVVTYRFMPLKICKGLLPAFFFGGGGGGGLHSKTSRLSYVRTLVHCLGINSDWLLHESQRCWCKRGITRYISRISSLKVVPLTFLLLPNFFCVFLILYEKVANYIKTFSQMLVWPNYVMRIVEDPMVHQVNL